MTTNPARQSVKTPSGTPTPIPTFCAELRDEVCGDGVVVTAAVAVATDIDVAVDVDVGAEVDVDADAELVAVAVAFEPPKFQSVGAGSDAYLLSTPNSTLVRFGGFGVPFAPSGSSSNTQPDSR
jgi:hypothetical protein